MHLKNATVLFLVAAGLVTGSASAQVAIYGVGAQSTGGGVSDGGLKATGQLAVTSLSAFVWTQGGSAVDIGGLTGSSSSTGVGFSADGSIAAGRCELASGPASFTWTSAGGAVSIGSIGGLGPVATSISHDGTTIVGTESFDVFINDPHLFRWRSGTGIQDLGIPVGAAFVRAGRTNASGSAIAGTAALNTGYYEAVRWNDSVGYQFLGTLTGASQSFASGINGSGTVIVGESDGTPFKWTEGVGMAALPTLSVLNLGHPADVSADGSVVVGSSDAIGYSPQATLWSAALGVVDLNVYLPTLGVDLSDWSLHSATDISPDGTAICGIGTHEYEPGMFQKECWVVVLPAPASGAVLLIAMGSLARRRGPRAAIRT